MLRVCLVLDGMSEGALDLWAYTFRHFGVDEVYVVGSVDDFRHLKPFRPAAEVRNADELPGELVVLSGDGARRVQPTHCLDDFTHPEDATYLFGSDAAVLDPAVLGARVPHAVVAIGTATDDEMHGHVAAAVVFHDRRVKRG